MKRLILIAAIVSLLFGVHSPDNTFIEDRILLLLDPDINTNLSINGDTFSTGYLPVDNILNEYGAESGRYLVPVRNMSRANQEKVWNFRNAILINFKPIDEIEVAEALRQIPGVGHADLDHLENDCLSPNDEYYGNQWYLPKIQADRAWKYVTGDDIITMTNYESVDWKHPEIGPILWNNLGEDADGDGQTVVYSPVEGWVFDPGDMNGADDDSNGYADDLIGWDFIAFEEDDLEPEEMHDLEDYFDEDMDPMDDVGEIGHGTHVAGTMIAASNNGVGIAGVNWSGRLCVLRGGYHYYNSHTGLTGTHPTSASVSAYIYATLMDIRVLNMSYGGYNYNGLVNSAIREQWMNNSFIVAAGGNDSVSDNHYPAAYTHVMGVAATDEDDMSTDFTCYGDRVDIAAPGDNIYAPVPRYDAGVPRSRPYDSKDGTSMASPVVSGSGALLWSYYPDSTNLFIYLRLEEYSDSLPDDPLWCSDSLGSGRVNVYRAIFQPIFPEMYLDTMGWYPSPTDPDGRIGVYDTGYVFIGFNSDAEWQDAEEVELELTAMLPEGYEGGIDFLNSPLTMSYVSAGGSVDNIANPLRFVPNEIMDAGRDVVFNVRLTSPTGYYIDHQLTIPIDYPTLLLYDRDGGSSDHMWIETDLARGQVPFYRWDADSLGIIDEDFLQSQFQTIVFINGQNEVDPITPEEATLFANFLDLGGERDILLAGQYLADDPDVTTLLADYFHTEHVADEVDSRFWGVNTVGIPGDTVTNNLHINIATGSDFMGPQRSIGQCASTGDAYEVMFYDGHEGVFCATRYENADYKTFFCEFSLAGISGSNPTGENRYQFLYRVLTWFGHPFMGIADSPLVIPDELSITVYPNPFNSALRIDAPNGSNIRIFATDGRLVEDLGQSNIWNAPQSIPSGIYLVSVEREGRITTKKAVLVR